MGVCSKEPWTEEICLGQVAPQSYEVKTKHGIFQRKRQMIRTEPQPVSLTPEPPVITTSSDETSICPEFSGASCSVASSDTPVKSKPVTPKQLSDTMVIPPDLELSDVNSSPTDNNVHVKQSHLGRTICPPPHPIYS